MSASLKISGYSSKNNAEFKRHLAVVKCCIENEVSFPEETSAFFKGKIHGNDLNHFKRDTILKHLDNGIEVRIKTTGDAFYDGGLRINVADIPKEVDELIIIVD